MPLRKQKLVNGNYYHIFNRGVEKRKIFLRDSDYLKFIETISHCLINKAKPSRGRFKPLNSDIEKPVDILAYCLMPNHFHLLVKQSIDRGIERYLQRLANSYAKYFNTKYDRVGALFQGPFKAVSVDSDEQLIHLSRYIHLNPVVAGITDDPKTFQWSSHKDYLNETETFLKPEVVLDNFASKSDYEQFVLDQVDYGKSLEELKHFHID